MRHSHITSQLASRAVSHTTGQAASHTAGYTAASYTATVLALVAGLSCLGWGQAAAQTSASSASAAELTRQLDQRKIDSFAARMGDDWVGVLYLAGSELLVVKGRLAANAGVEALAGRKAYRDIYISLHTAADPASKVLVSDMGANGLNATPNGRGVADRIDLGGKSYTFDGNAGRAGGEQEYNRVFRTADDQYRGMLDALLAELRRGA